MSTRVPRSYDEITRSTVPEPDGGWRPTPEQEKQALEGFRALDADEQELLDRVEAALAASGVDRSRVKIEIARDRVTLRGAVRSGDTIDEIIRVVRKVDGVDDIVDRVVIQP